MYSVPGAVHAYICRLKALRQLHVFREEDNNYVQLTRKRKYSGELSPGMEDIGSRKVIRLAATVGRQEVDRIVPGTQPVERGRWLQLKLFKKKCFHSYSALVIDYFIFR